MINFEKSTPPKKKIKKKNKGVVFGFSCSSNIFFFIRNNKHLTYLYNFSIYQCTRSICNGFETFWFTNNSQECHIFHSLKKIDGTKTLSI